jgi:hypothetical protein
MRAYAALKEATGHENRLPRNNAGAGKIPAPAFIHMPPPAAFPHLMWHSRSGVMRSPCICALQFEKIFWYHRE